MVAHKTHHVLYRYFLNSFYPKRHSICSISRTRIVYNSTFYIVPILSHIRTNLIKHSPNANFAKTSMFKCHRRIGIRETKFIISNIFFCITRCSCKRYNISSVKRSLFWIIPIIYFLIFKRSNSCLICMSAYITIWNLHCNPNCAFAIRFRFRRAFPNNFEYPNFVCIRNRKRFTFAVISILRHQVGNYLNCFASCFRAL